MSLIEVSLLEGRSVEQIERLMHAVTDAVVKVRARSLRTEPRVHRLRHRIIRPQASRGKRRGRMTIRRILLLLAVLAIPVALGACGDNKESISGNGLTKVTVGYLPSIDNAFFWRAQDAGYYRDEGLDVKLVPTEGGPAVVAGVVSESFVIGQSDVVSLLSARSKGLNLKTVLFYRFDTPKAPDLYIMSKDPEVKGPRDLVGKSIGVNVLNGISQLAAQEWLREAGINPKQVKFMEVPFPDVNTALASNQVTAATSLDPFKGTGETQGQHVVGTDVDSLRQRPGEPIAIAGLVTTGKTLGEKPDVIEGVVAAARRALNDLADPAVLRQTLVRHLKLSEAAVKQVTPIDYDDPIYSRPPGGDALEPWKRAGIRYGWFKPDLNLDDAIGEVP